MKKVIDFVKEAKAELIKVNWPTRKQTLNYTILVVAVSLIVAAFLGGLDYLFSIILKDFLIK
jgi:preprotein translocase subunit SecE